MSDFDNFMKHLYFFLVVTVTVVNLIYFKVVRRKVCKYLFMPCVMSPCTFHSLLMTEVSSSDGMSLGPTICNISREEKGYYY